jgi:DNA-binding LacI/PurR family transcriptional regulator
LILGAPRSRPDELAALGRQAGVPMVFLNREVHGRLVASVWVDWPSATSEVVEYLAGLGHRRIALVVHSREAAPFASREDWYERALGRGDLTPPPSLIVRERISIDGGHRAGLRLLSLDALPTAVICHNDTMAIGVLQACAERRVRVPHDLSVVGWDDVPYASPVAPPLTTVRVPRHELGCAAAATLLDLMVGRPAREPDPVPLQLICRQSCCRIERSTERTRS